MRAEQLEVLMAVEKDTIRTATFSGDVQMDASGDQPMQGNAGRVILNFVGKNQPTSVRAEQNVKLQQHQRPATAQAEAQDLEITAPAIDFFFSKTRHMERAETSGPPQIALRPSDGNSLAQQTLVTAAKFVASFDKAGLNSVHGASNARIATTTPGESDRISTSDSLDVLFRPGKGIESIAQQDNFIYVDGERKAWAKRARYTSGRSNPCPDGIAANCGWRYDEYGEFDEDGPFDRRRHRRRRC